MIEDEILVSQFKSGDAEAFSKLKRKYHERILSYVRRIVKHEDAEKVVQEVFAKIHEMIPQWQPQRVSFATWLYTIVRNQCADYHRVQMLPLSAVSKRPPYYSPN